MQDRSEHEEGCEDKDEKEYDEEEQKDEDNEEQDTMQYSMLFQTVP